jgi:hypothetical protein
VGFDSHVVCVNESSSEFQAVGRKQCQYVEVVVAEEAQMLPVAVLWFEVYPCIFVLMHIVL